MNRKALVLALSLSIAAAASASAATAAVGAEFGLNGIGNGLGSSAYISFRLPKYPVVFGVGGTLSGEASSLALLADWWLASGKLVSFLDYYVGPGVFADFGSYGAYAGLRIPVGVNAFPIKPLELFLEFAPSFTIVTPSAVDFGWSGFQSGFGFRFWF